MTGPSSSCPDVRCLLRDQGSHRRPHYGVAVDEGEVVSDILGVAQAQETLLARLDGTLGTRLTDDHVGRASRLPGWSVGHVLAHLSQHAASFLRLIESSSRGEVGRQYPGGPIQRAADIERESTVGADHHLTQLARTFANLNVALSRVADTPVSAQWCGRAEMASGAVVTIRDLPLRRWREVEVHTGDLGLIEFACDGPESWSQEYVRRDLRVLTMQWKSRGSMGLNSLPESAVRLDDRMRLAWLLGRAEVAGLSHAGLM